LPGPTEDYFAYVRWFERHHGALLLPVDCIEPVDPIFTYTNQYTWEMEWVLIFTDPKAYVRIMELHAKVAGLYFSRRIRFSYHYGPLPKVDAQGLPNGNPPIPFLSALTTPAVRRTFTLKMTRQSTFRRRGSQS